MAHFREISDELYTISTIPGIFDKPDRVVKEAPSVARLPSVLRLLENDFGDI